MAEDIRSGGDLRIPLSAYPDTFNTLHLNGGGDVVQVMDAVLPRAYRAGPDGTPVLDRDLLVSAEATGTELRYMIRDDARWSNGRPVDWTDFAGQVAAVNGAEAGYTPAGIPGYDAIDRVERGAEDREVRVVLRRPLGEWQHLFSPLHPAELTGNVDAFNEGWRDGPEITAGPFRIGELDDVAQTIVLERDPGWWGTAAHLDRVVYLVVVEGRPDLFANGELDSFPVTSVDGLVRARDLPDADVRVAAAGRWTHLTFNGAPGRLLSDRSLRRAVARAVDRAEIAERIVGPTTRPILVGSRVLPPGAPGHVDNSGALAFDPARAAAELDALGWTLPPEAGPDAVRVKGGRELRLLLPEPPGAQAAGILSVQLGRVGVGVDRQLVPAERLLEVVFGDRAFDLHVGTWDYTQTPVSVATSLVVDPTAPAGPGNNAGWITTPEIRRLLDLARGEPDPGARAELANAADRLMWDEAHSLPLYLQPGVHVVRRDLANWGAFGLAAPDPARAGYRR